MVIKIKFIFPQNYNFKSKIFGWLDYWTAIINVIWGVILFGILNIFPFSLNVKIFIFIMFFSPVFMFSIVGFNGENIVCVCSYLIKYMLKTKILLYKK